MPTKKPSGAISRREWHRSIGHQHARGHVHWWAHFISWGSEKKVIKAPQFERNLTAINGDLKLFTKTSKNIQIFSKGRQGRVSRPRLRHPLAVDTMPHAK